MVGGAHAKLCSGSVDRLGRCPGRAPQFNAISTASMHFAHPRFRSFSGGHIAARKHGVHDQSRSGDLTCLAAITMSDGPVQPHSRASLAHRGNAVRQPEFEHILRGRDRTC